MDLEVSHRLKKRFHRVEEGQSGQRQDLHQCTQTQCTPTPQPSAASFQVLSFDALLGSGLAAEAASEQIAFVGDKRGTVARSKAKANF